MFTKKIIASLTGLLATAVLGGSSIATQAYNTIAPQQATIQQQEELEHRGAKDNPIADYLSKEDVAAATASALGMSVAELQAARDAGSKLPELAEAAGVSIDDIKAAVEIVFTDAVNAALADEAITQEQADKMLEHGPRFGKGKGNHGQGNGNGPQDNPLADYLSKEDVAAATASALGMSVAELQAAHDAGTKLPELAETAGVSIDEIKAAVETIFTDAVNAALADEAITQEQADKMLEHGPRFGKGKGGHGQGNGHGPKDGRPGEGSPNGNGRPGQGRPNQNNSNSTPILPNNQSNG